MHKLWAMLALPVAPWSCGGGDRGDGGDEISGDAADVVGSFELAVGANIGPEPHYPGQLASTYVAAVLTGDGPWPEVRFAITSAPPGIDAAIEPAVGVDLADGAPGTPPDYRSNLRWSIADDVAPGRYVIGFRATAGQRTADGNVAFDVVAAEAPGLVAGAELRFVAIEAGGEIHYRARATAVGGAAGRLGVRTRRPGTPYGADAEVTIATPTLAANGSTDIDVRCRAAIDGADSPCAIQVALGRHVVDVPLDVYARAAAGPAIDLTWSRDVTPALAPDGTGELMLGLVVDAASELTWPPTIEVTAPPGLDVAVDTTIAPTVKLTVHRDAAVGATTSGPVALEVHATLGALEATATPRVLFLPGGGEWPFLGGAPLPLVPVALALDEHGRPAVTSARGMLRWSGTAWLPASSLGLPFLYTADGVLWELGVSPSLAVFANGRQQILSAAGNPRDASLALDVGAGAADALPLVMVDVAGQPLQFHRTTPTFGTHNFTLHSTMPLEAIERDTFARFAVYGDQLFVLLRGAPGLALWGYDADGWTPRATPSATLGALPPQLRVDPAGRPVVAWLDPAETVHVQRLDGGWTVVAPPIAHPDRIVQGLELAFGPDGRAVVLVASVEHALGSGARLDLARETPEGWRSSPPITPVDPDAILGMSGLAIDPGGAAYVVDAEGPLAAVRWRASP